MKMITKLQMSAAVLATCVHVVNASDAEQTQAEVTLTMSGKHLKLENVTKSDLYQNLSKSYKGTEGASRRTEADDSKREKVQSKLVEQKKRLVEQKKKIEDLEKDLNALNNSIRQSQQALLDVNVLTPEEVGDKEPCAVVATIGSKLAASTKAAADDAQLLQSADVLTEAEKKQFKELSPSKDSYVKLLLDMLAEARSNTEISEFFIAEQKEAYEKKLKELTAELTKAQDALAQWESLDVDDDD